MMKRALIVVAATVVLSLAFAQTAWADTTVPAGQSVVEATVIGDDLTLNGTSHGSVVVIDGNLTLGPHARAEDGVTVIGGHLSAAPGAVVQGDVFQIGAMLPHPSAAQLGAALLVLLLVRFALVWLIWRVALILGRADGAHRMFDEARERPLRAVLVGVLLTAGLSAAALLLALTIVAAPLALALFGVLLGFGALGLSFTRRLPQLSASDNPVVLAVLAVPIIGDAALALATIVGAGALFHHLVDHRVPRARGALPEP